MRFAASKALTAAAFFLALVAILINAPNMFYMATALTATIFASHLQAWLAIRWLRIERIPLGLATVGEVIAVEMIVWSERRMRRPLVIIRDELPGALNAFDVSYSLPVAPDADTPVRMRYTFRPGRRGVFRWRRVRIEGFDALGVVSKFRDERTENEAVLTVLPRPIPVSIELPLASGFGLSEAESGQNRGAGLDLYGLREYVPGDPLKRIHWRSYARTGNLLVKEFEAGSHAAGAFLLPLRKTSDIGRAPSSSLDVMVGHVAFLASELLLSGARVSLPQLEPMPPPPTHPERREEIFLALAQALADHEFGPAHDLRAATQSLQTGSAIYVMLAQPDFDLPDAIAHATARGLRVCVLFYDATRFDRKAKALTPTYLDELIGAGAIVEAMPHATQEVAE